VSTKRPNDGIWVSSLNSRSTISRKEPVRFYDTTLRDGEQTVGVVLSPQQKLEIARKLDELGVSRIEAGFPRVSPDDAEAIRLIQNAGLKTEVWGFARAVKADVDELLRLGTKRFIIETPTSDIKLSAYGISRDEAVRRATEAVAYAKKSGAYVMFFAVDGSRSDLDFLKKIYVETLAAGAAEIAVVDTIGACGPEAVEFLVREACSWVGPSVPVHFHGHNDFGMATACAVAAVRGGASWIQGTINGMGERAGNADIGEIALALRCLYGVEVDLDLAKIRATSEIVRRAAGYEVDGWKPLVGENLFMRESGAVASQFHIPEAIEPYSADLVAAERKIVLGKKSGLDSIDLKAKELALQIPREKRDAVLAGVKKKGIEKRGLLTDQEFREIVSRVQSSAAAD
jgi:isopropylmalate/homocitrate/citramalate synthase